MTAELFLSWLLLITGFLLVGLAGWCALPVLFADPVEHSFGTWVQTAPILAGALMFAAAIVCVWIGMLLRQKSGDRQRWPHTGETK